MWTHPEHSPEPRNHQPPPTKPLPLVNPPAQHQPHARQSPYTIRDKIFNFILSSALFTLAFVALRYYLGSITGIPGLDSLCYWAGLAFYFFAYILTDFGPRWAEKYCGFLKK